MFIVMEEALSCKAHYGKGLYIHIRGELQYIKSFLSKLHIILLPALQLQSYQGSQLNG